MKTPVVFFHIPKTAGTSFHKVLSEVYPEDRTFSVSGADPREKLRELEKLPKKNKDELLMLKGHLLLNADQLLEKECIFLSFFRDPVDRTISSYHYLKKAAHNRFHQEVKRIALKDFPAFLLEKKWDNLQTRFLATSPHHIREPESREGIRQLEQEGLPRAFEVLNEMIDHPLITEEFDRSIVYLARELDWPRLPVPDVRNRSRSGNRKRPSGKLLQSLESVNELDMELYEKARSIFHQKLDTVWDDNMEEMLQRIRQRGGESSMGRKGIFAYLKGKGWI